MAFVDYWRTEVAFGTAPNATTPNYRDVTSYVDAVAGVSVTKGRTDQFTAVTPSQATCTFDNHDGRFSAENTSSPYYPSVLLGTRVRHSFRQTTSGNPTVAGNFLSANAASMESSVAAWAPGGSVPPTLSQSNTHVQDGSQALLVTWGTAGSLPLAQTVVSGLVIGRQYTASAYFYVPVGSPAALLSIAGSFSSSTTVTATFQRRNVTWTATAVAHTLQVWPASAPTAGNQVWVDAVQVDEGTAVGTFTTSAPPIFYRFDGCVDQWPTQWAPTGLYAEAQVAATDRLKRLGLSRSLPDVIGCEYLLDAPNGYYNLGDGEGSTAAGNSAATSQPSIVQGQVGSGGTLTFGTGTGPGTDGLSALVLTRVNGTNGKYLSGNMSSQLGGAFAITLECWFNTSTLGPGSGAMTIMSVQSIYGSYFAIEVENTGSVFGTLKDRTGGLGTFATCGGGTVTSDGLTHHAVMTVSSSGTTASFLFYLDGVVSVFTASISATFLLAAMNLRIGGFGTSGVSELFNGTVAQVAVYPTALSAARILQHYLAGSTGFAGERSDQRISRLAVYGGINVADVIAAENGSSLLQAQDTTGGKALDLINTATDTENGVTFFSGAGKLTTHGRSHRYAATSKMTLGAGTYTPDLQPVLDDFGVQNDVTASRANGVTVRVVNQTSIDAIGYYTGQLDLITNTDAEVSDAANWRVQTAGVPAVRYPTLSIDLSTQPIATALQILALEIGDRITVSGMPSTGPATSVDLFIEGWQETFTATSYVITFNCTRATAAAGAVWIFDNSASVFDTMRFGY